MNAKNNTATQVMMATREYGMSSVLFRNAVGRRLGLSTTDSECFSLLSIKGIATPTEIARYTGLTTGSTTAMLDRLEKANMITRKPNPHDRRGVLIEINKKAMKAFIPLSSGVMKAQTELLASYSEADLATIADFLTRFSRNVTDYAKTIEKSK